MRFRYFALSFFLIVAGCRRNPPPVLPGFNAAAPIRPDARMTPGDALDVTPRDFCTPGYSKKVRDVSQSLKEKIYRQYGIRSRKNGEYSIDHLIPLQMGGSNSIKNLWPQSYKTQPWNGHTKNALGTRLRDKICAGELDMKTAQRDIATDWIAAYKKYFNTNAPLRSYTLNDAGERL